MQKRQVWMILFISLLIKGVLSQFFELNNDEVYYWTYTMPLQLSYFDHPPLIAVLLRATTFNLHFESEFFLRLGPMLCSVISGLLVYKIAAALQDELTGLYALILFQLSPYCAIIAGLFVLPDAPQLVFWLMSILFMVKIAQASGSDRKLNRLFLLLGVSTGLCILAKIHGLVLWPGFLLFIIFFRPALLKNPYLYYSILLTAILLLPILIWNMENNFITYRFHSNRVNTFSFHPESLVRELAGELAYNNPFYIGALIAAFYYFKKHPGLGLDPVYKILVFTSFPLIGVVIFISFFNDTLPHWSGPAYATLIPFAAVFLRAKSKSTVISRWFRNQTLLRYSLIYAGLFLLLPLIMLQFLPPLSPGTTWNKLGKNDLLLDMSGWKRFGAQMDSLSREQGTAGATSSNTFYISDYWFPAAHIEYYAARPYRHSFLAIGELTAIHHYAWRNVLQAPMKKGDNVYFITVSNYFNAPGSALRNLFDSVYAPVLIPQFRNAKPVRNFIIYRMENFHGPLPPSGVLVQYAK